MTEELENDTKIIQIIKICAIIIIGFIIGVFALFFIGITKVDAANAIGGYMGANDTNGVWWKESDLNYRCGWGGPSTACGTFDRALAILYNYQPSTSDTLTLSMTIYSQADYTSNKAWNNDIYILWGYGSNLYYNWSLRDSCTVDVSQTVTPINSLTNRKQFKIDISCSAKPPISGAYPVIYDLQTFSNGTWGGLSNYVFEVAYVNGTLSKNGDNSDIINNQNQNTQQIMENDNKNADKIADSVGANTAKLQEIEDNLNDTSPGDPNILSGINLPSDQPITNLLTLPITLIQKFINGNNASCSPINLGKLYGTDIIFPCINVQKHLGSELYGNIDKLIVIFMFYEIAMLFVSAWDGFTSLRDEYETLAYGHAPGSSAYNPDIYVPRHGG